MAVFLSNGLLGGGQQKEPATEPSTSAKLPSFVPTDLLNPIEEDTSTSTRHIDPADANQGLSEPPTFTLDKDSMTESRSFVSNGLLSGAEPVDTNQDPSARISMLNTETTPASRSFVSNGLLSSTEPIEANQDQSPQTPAPNTETTPASHSFVSNGLLSNIASSTSSFPMDRPPQASSSTLRFNVQARTFSGKAVYIRKKSKLLTNQPTQQLSSQKIGKLLDVPIHRLMDELSAATAARLAALPSREIDTKNAAPEDTLLVDRYRPRRYVELIGSERVARDTMTWVKMWDWCVFGRKKGKKRARDGDEELYDDDEYHRPRDKLLLLSGPPGLGKTTLAHVIARQAGYEVMEINASDARSGQIVDDRIKPTLEAGATIGSKKPVLLIIDEIDGATGAGDSSATFIHKLVQLTQQKSKKKRNGQKNGPEVKKPILRPIICICNDHNAASLAKLRPYAYQIRMSRPADIHTVKRLRTICDAEGLKAETRALGTLVGIARGDLRSCLNTLQFIKSRSDEVTEAMIRRATAGTREADNTISSVLNSLFNPMTRKRVKELGLTEDQEGRYVSRLSQEIDAVGKESSIATGCFAHYANLRQLDANFSRYEKANEWLGVYDYMTSAMYSEGEFALSQYIPYLLIPFHPLFQERGSARVERSQADWEHSQTRRTNEEIFKSLAGCIRIASGKLGGSYRQFMSSPVLETEFAPYLNRIISPPLRPVNSQIVRPEERTLLTRLVNIMASLELRFMQERAEDGQLTYRLDPPIDVFVNYDGKRAVDITVTRYAVRHIVAGEVEAKLTGQRVDIVERSKPSFRSFFGSSDKSNAPSRTRLGDHADGPPSKRIKVDLADKPPTDFFGRPIDLTKITVANQAHQKKHAAKCFKISYRFAEGNSAAVRRPVKLDSFL
ncbi:Chromosome transmission fidelity protein 18 [Pleurotus ostreatus]|nr:Chromosome transmission fidelity protein 18 [Pleurotus ostreatus]